jgi:hypothetical protein
MISVPGRISVWSSSSSWCTVYVLHQHHLAIPRSQGTKPRCCHNPHLLIEILIHLVFSRFTQTSFKAHSSQPTCVCAYDAAFRSFNTSPSASLGPEVRDIPLPFQASTLHPRTPQVPSIPTSPHCKCGYYLFRPPPAATPPLALTYPPAQSSPALSPPPLPRRLWRDTDKCVQRGCVGLYKDSDSLQSLFAQTVLTLSKSLLSTYAVGQFHAHARQQ